MSNNYLRSFDFDLIISNGNEDSSLKIGIIHLSEVHRITLTNVSWISGNIFTLINNTMRQRLNLDLHMTFPSQYLNLKLDNGISICGSYRPCEVTYLSVDPVAYKIRSIVYPICVPELPVDFVLGTMSFEELELSWSSKLNRLITRREEEEDARRQSYRNIL